MPSKEPIRSPDEVRLRLTGFSLAAVLLAATVLAQATLLARVRFFGASPNLVLVVVVSWGLLQSIEEGLVWGFLAGLATDAISGMPLGTSSLALMAGCLFAGVGERPVFQRHLFLPMIGVAAATPVYAWLILASEAVRRLPVDWGGTTVRVIIPELLLNVVLITVVFPVLRWLAARSGAERMGW
jgi:rod shape-determining protein MreD